MADSGATPDTPAEDVPADHPAGAFPGTVWVHYGQIYLVDGEWDLPEWETLKATGVGIVGVQPGAAILLTGLHTGTVGFSAVVADSDPGAEFEESVNKARAMIRALNAAREFESAAAGAR